MSENVKAGRDQTVSTSNSLSTTTLRHVTVESQCINSLITKTDSHLRVQWGENHKAQGGGNRDSVTWVIRRNILNKCVSACVTFITRTERAWMLRRDISNNRLCPIMKPFLSWWEWSFPKWLRPPQPLRPQGMWANWTVWWAWKWCQFYAMAFTVASSQPERTPTRDLGMRFQTELTIAIIKTSEVFISIIQIQGRV